MIMLYDGYAINVDSVQYTFGKLYADKKGGERFKPITYHRTLKDALKSFRAYSIRNKLSDGKTPLSQALTLISEFDNQFEKFVDENIPNV